MSERCKNCGEEYGIHHGFEASCPYTDGNFTTKDPEIDVLRKEIKRLREELEGLKNRLDKEWPPINPSIDEALNSGDGRYKP